MINAKRLSLKTLNTLNEVSVELEIKIIPLQTFEKIPVGCRQTFEYDGKFTEHAARMALKKLNGNHRQDWYLLRNSDDGYSVTVYHLTKDIAEQALNDRKDEIRKARKARQGYRVDEL